MRRLGCVFVVIAGLTLVPISSAASGGGGCYGPIKDRRASSVKMKDFCFDPAVVRIPKGGEVEWTNLDEVKHNVSAGPLWGTRVLREGDRTTVRFSREGIFSYVCILHTGMAGTVVVGDGYSGPTIRGKAADIKVTSFERKRPRRVSDADGSDSTPFAGEAAAAKAAPPDAGERSSLWGPAIALMVIAALCAFALVTGRSAGRRKENEEDNILRK